MEKLKAKLLINLYHISTPYLYVGQIFFVLKQMFVVPAIGITDY